MPSTRTSLASWSSYPSIFNLGHRAVADLLKGPVLVEEKVDGSQFSFGVFPIDEGPPELADIRHPEAGPCDILVRSKGCVLTLGAPEKLFTRAVESVKERAHLLTPGWTYRAEYLAKPKHNTLAYDRTPTGNLAVFDVNTGDQEFLGYDAKAAEAARVGLEVVPLIHRGAVEGLDAFRDLLDRVSFLGGQKIEGVVVKPVNYDLWGPDKKVLLGKFVSEAFKEVHGREFRKENPTGGDILDRLVERFKTPARWAKAVQHLREAGRLTDTPKDIGALMAEVPADVEKEERDAILTSLWAWAWPHLRRRLCGGMPEWYKDLLLKKQFEEQPS